MIYAWNVTPPPHSIACGTPTQLPSDVECHQHNLNQHLPLRPPVVEAHHNTATATTTTTTATTNHHSALSSPHHASSRLPPRLGLEETKRGAGLVGPHLGIPFVGDIPNIPLRGLCFVGCPSFQGGMLAAGASESCRCDHSLPPQYTCVTSHTLATHWGHTGNCSYCPPAYSRRQCTVLH